MAALRTAREAACAAGWAIDPELAAAPFRLATGHPSARFRGRLPGGFTASSVSLAVGVRFAHEKALRAWGNALSRGVNGQGQPAEAPPPLVTVQCLRPSRNDVLPCHR